jgi:hypothetical protein
MTEKIKQLIPAESWYALYWTPKPPYYSLRRLLAFALIEAAGGETTLDAIDQDECRVKLGGLGSDSDAFAGYFREAEIDDEFRRTKEEVGKRRAGR